MIRFNLRKVLTHISPILPNMSAEKPDAIAKNTFNISGL